MIKKILLLLMLFIGLALQAAAPASILPGTIVTPANDFTDLAVVAGHIPVTALRRTSLDSLPNNKGKATISVVCDHHLALESRIIALDKAIKAARSDTERNRMTAKLDRLYQEQTGLIWHSIEQATKEYRFLWEGPPRIQKS